jgi:hypothetical protein
MNVEHVQEDAEPNTAILQKPGLKFFFNSDDLAVTGRDHKTGPLGDVPGGIPEEPGDKKRRDGGTGCRESPSEPPCQ